MATSRTSRRVSEVEVVSKIAYAMGLLAGYSTMKMGEVQFVVPNSSGGSNSFLIRDSRFPRAKFLVTVTKVGARNK